MFSFLMCSSLTREVFTVLVSVPWSLVLTYLAASLPGRPALIRLLTQNTMQKSENVRIKFKSRGRYI